MVFRYFMIIYVDSRGYLKQQVIKVFVVEAEMGRMTPNLAKNEIRAVYPKIVDLIEISAKQYSYHAHILDIFPPKFLSPNN